MIKAVRDRITQAGMLPTLVGQAGPLLDALGNSIDTNFTLDEMIRLADLATHIDPASIQSFVIEPSMTLPYMAPTDPPQAVLVPIRDEVRQLRDRFLSSGLPATPVPAGADAATRLATEAAAIRVENGTLSVGLAARTRDYLAQRGFRIESFGDAFDGRTDHVTTIIIDYAGKPFTASHIAAALGVPDASVQSAAANGDGIDVRVVLGNDYAAGLGSQLLLTPVPTP